mmetsp:Transcript_6630/g.16566  ORF Transcript_6630/g.16566 Transcript_6630/m.16566 type:complete len:341 (-) Transcript_6630:235-1257(-)
MRGLNVGDASSSDGAASSFTTANRADPCIFDFIDPPLFFLRPRLHSASLPEPLPSPLSPLFAPCELPPRLDTFVPRPAGISGKGLLTSEPDLLLATTSPSVEPPLGLDREFMTSSSGAMRRERRGFFTFFSSRCCAEVVAFSRATLLPPLEYDGLLAPAEFASNAPFPSTSASWSRIALVSCKRDCSVCSETEFVISLRLFTFPFLPKLPNASASNSSTVLLECDTWLSVSLSRSAESSFARRSVLSPAINKSWSELSVLNSLFCTTLSAELSARMGFSTEGLDERDRASEPASISLLPAMLFFKDGRDGQSIKSLQVFQQATEEMSKRSASTKAPYLAP